MSDKSASLSRRLCGARGTRATTDCRRNGRPLLVEALERRTLLSHTPAHTLFLQFDGDAAYPEFGDSFNETSPLAAFDASELDNGFGAAETAQIIDGVLAYVRQAYEDFDLQVTATPPGGGDFQTVGIDHAAAETFFGLADSEEDDPDDGDFARVWAGGFENFPEWQGANSTVQRWVNAIGGTVAHEAGHNYDLNHAWATPTPIEEAAGDLRLNHIMASPACDHDFPGDDDCEARAAVRHFSDTSYSHLAGTLGLKTNSLTSLNLKNPNSQDAHDFHVIVLSAFPSLTVEAESSQNPWANVDTSLLAVIPVQPALSLFVHEIGWHGGNVQAGENFHVGVAFQETNTYSILDMFLTDAQGEPLPLKPRARTIELTGLGASGDLTYSYSNGGDRPIVVRDLRYRSAARLIDLESMDRDARLVGSDGRPVNLLDDVIVAPDQQLRPRQSRDFVAGNLFDWLMDLAPRLHDDGGGGRAPADPISGGAEPGEAAADRLQAMFPAPYVYVTSTVVSPDQTVWNPQSGRFERQDLVSEQFQQLAGLPQTIVRADIEIDPPREIKPLGLAKKRDLVTVVLFGRESLDVTLVDPSTLRFGPEGARPTRPLSNHGRRMQHLQDVDQDGKIDLVIHFSRTEAGIAAEDTRACLIGGLRDDTLFAGCASVQPNDDAGAQALRAVGDPSPDARHHTEALLWRGQSLDRAFDRLKPEFDGAVALLDALS